MIMHRTEIDELAYLEDGSEVAVCSHLEDGSAVVQLLHLDEEGGPDEVWLGNPRLVSKVFDKPPVASMDRGIQELKKTESKLDQSIADKTQKLAELESKRKEIEARLVTDTALRRVMDWIDGKVTHYVVIRWSGLAIFEAEPGGAIPDSTEFGHRDGTKLIVLFGKSDGNLGWGINHYKDGSGSYEECEPFHSLDAAKARLQELVDLWEQENPGRHRYILDSARKYGLDVPAGLAKAVANAEIAAAQKNVDRSKEELAAHKEVLRTLVEKAKAND